jgi:carbon storage regulator
MAMLVLSRKTNERILVGDNIEILVLETRGNRVSLGFIAPAEVSICRGELLDRISAEAATKSPCDDRLEIRSGGAILHT